jgi:putative hemolysin
MRKGEGKMKKRLSALGFVLVLSVVLSGCGPGTAQPTESPTVPPTGGNVGLANPASVYCEDQGYTLEMRVDENGQYGVCIFPDGSECEEWAFYRGECSPGAGFAAAGQTVVGWFGNVVSTPDDAQFDDYLVLQPEGAGEVGLEGIDETIAAEIVALRDKEEPGKYAHFWGTLTCDVPDYGGCQLLVTRVRSGPTYTDPEPVEAWEGVVVSNPPEAQFDDYFILGGDFPVGYGISSLDPALAAQLESLRDTGITIRLWGQIRTGVPDAYGSQIEVTRLESVESSLPPMPAPEVVSEPVENWWGEIEVWGRVQ